MKKLLALLLVAAMLVCVLAACGGTETPAADPAPADPAAEAPAAEDPAPADPAAEEPAPEQPAAETPAAEEPAGDKITVDFTWNGQKEVWSVLPTTGAEGLIIINDAMGAVMEAEGFTYVKKDAQGDPSAQVSFIEDAIAAGNVGAIMCAAMAVDMLQDIVIEALEAGIAVVYLGAEPTAYGVSGCVYTAYEITGMWAVEAAEDWALNSGANVPTNADGKYEVACDIYTDIQDGVYRSNAICGTVDNSANLVRISTTTSYGNSAYSSAYDNAQDCLGAHPDCHIFIAYEPEEAMGAADAIADYCDMNGLSVADYCVIPCYAEDTTFTEMWEAASADPSANAIKGYATYGDPVQIRKNDAGEDVVIIPPVLTGEHLADLLLSACGFDGYTWEYGQTYYDTITCVNTCGFEKTWSMGDENPAIQYKVPEFTY